MKAALHASWESKCHSIPLTTFRLSFTYVIITCTEDSKSDSLLSTKSTDHYTHVKVAKHLKINSFFKMVSTKQILPWTLEQLTYFEGKTRVYKQNLARPQVCGLLGCCALRPGRCLKNLVRSSLTNRPWYYNKSRDVLTWKTVIKIPKYPLLPEYHLVKPNAITGQDNA